MYDSTWVVMSLRDLTRKGRLYNAASSLTIAVVGLFTKVLSAWFNKVTVFNKDVMTTALQRPQRTPLITISNHHSCFDDPGIWGAIPIKYLCSKRHLRWSLAAHDICFTNVFHTVFFMLGKCIPVVRGIGVYQPALDFCIEQLHQGSWVHIFPEGKVNLTKETMRFKWGIGRLVYECPQPPIIVPIWHEGMDKILPNQEPYILKFNKRFYVNYGKPISIQSLVEDLKQKNASPEEARKVITDLLQERLYKLKDETLKLISESQNAEQNKSNKSKRL